LHLARSVVRIVLLFFFAATLIARAEEAISGHWEGTVQVPGRELKMLVDLARQSDAWVGSITIPGRIVKGAALTDILVSGADVTFAIKSALGDAKSGGASFKAHVNGNKLTGDFVQGGNTAPFSLEKVGPPQVEFPPVSTDIVKELESEWRGEYELFGYSRKVTVKLTNRPTGGATAEFVVVGKKVNNLPVEVITQEGDLVTVDSPSTGLRYEGRFRNGEIKGAIIQGSIETPLVLQRAR
jgi:hypothetical protein